MSIYLGKNKIDSPTVMNDVLLYNSGKVVSGAVALSESYKNFRQLIIVLIANVDYDVRTVPTDLLEELRGQSKYLFFSAESYNESVRSDISLTVTSETALNVQSSRAGNPDWQLGVWKVYGVR